MATCYYGFNSSKTFILSNNGSHCGIRNFSSLLIVPLLFTWFPLLNNHILYFTGGFFAFPHDCHYTLQCWSAKWVKTSLTLYNKLQLVLLDYSQKFCEKQLTEKFNFILFKKKENIVCKNIFFILKYVIKLQICANLIFSCHLLLKIDTWK